MRQQSSLARMLKSKNISPTYQRLAVLRELMGRRDHPRAEDIWFSLKQAEPPISKATVYNVLKLLVEKKVLRPVFIDADSVRYDIQTDGHGHFHCDSCGAIFNFEARTDSSPPPELEGFEISQRDLYYRGLCPDCRAQAPHPTA